MRQDVLTGDWISVAAARQNRVFLPPPTRSARPADAENPSEVPSLYDVAVFENRSPSFGPASPTRRTRRSAWTTWPSSALGRTAPSVGRCEVVCFSPEHEGSLGNPPPTGCAR